VLERRLERLLALGATGGRRVPRGLEELRATPACPVCVDVDASVASARTTLLGRLGDPAWAEALAAARLCLDDLLALWQVVARSDGRVHEAWRPVGAAQVGRVSDMLAAAQRYVAHSGHDRQSELTDAEREAADRIVALLAGEGRERGGA